MSKMIIKVINFGGNLERFTLDVNDYYGLFSECWEDNYGSLSEISRDDNIDVLIKTDNYNQKFLDLPIGAIESVCSIFDYRPEGPLHPLVGDDMRKYLSHYLEMSESEIGRMISSAQWSWTKFLSPR